MSVVSVEEPLLEGDAEGFLAAYLPWFQPGSKNIHGTANFEVAFYLVVENLMDGRESDGLSDAASKVKLEITRVQAIDRLTIIPMTVGDLYYYVSNLHCNVHYGEFPLKNLDHFVLNVHLHFFFRFLWQPYCLKNWKIF